jgi:hypothetical protein
MGDQFIALMEGPIRAARGHRHFGLVVDDRTAVRTLATEAGAELLDGPFLDFLDPWGNLVEVVDYSDVQFTKASHILQGMGLELSKSEKAQRELAKKGMAPRALRPRLTDRCSKGNSVLSMSKTTIQSRAWRRALPPRPADPLYAGSEL